jgi:Ni,Fe-hydrogenase maturation factor
MAIAAGLVMRTSRGPAPFLLIGIGNPLRGDDGVGPWLVETWGRRRAWRGAVHGAQRGEGGDLLARLQVRVVDQLLPELAADLATAGRVLFVDAWRGDPGAGPLASRSGPRLLPIAAAERRAEAGAGWGTPGWTPGHQLAPAVLLQLTEGLYGRAPAAQSLLIPATAFAVTDPGGGSACFSAGLRMELPRAWLLLDQWLQEGEVSVNEEGAPEIRSLLA